MKKIIYLLIVSSSVLFSQNLQAQGFTYTPLGNPFVNLPYIQDSTQVVQIQAIVRNNSSSDLNFRFARIINDMPAGWETQMCYDLCYATFVDTIAPPSTDPPYTITPNHQDTLFYIDFTTNGKGTGTAIVQMYNTDNPGLYIQDTFKVQIGDVGITNISSLVDDYELSQNYPNPFNPNTSINFSITSNEIVSLIVYDIIGNEVASLVNNERLSAGKYKADFNGAGLSSGIYYYTIKTESFSDTKKMVLVK
ncbi:MAG: T9SS type A sorting domain-containing protein [Bacteroidota bacterium]|nr:T9SS type A sorting domain-containing protein [Bacteroidota bacterium]